MWEQTTVYNSAPYCGRLPYSRLCFAHCRDMHSIAPHVDTAAHWTTAAESLISSSAVGQGGSPKDSLFCLLFQSKEWLILSKWLGSPSSSSAVNQEG